LLEVKPVELETPPATLPIALPADAKGLANILVAKFPA